MDSVPGLEKRPSCYDEYRSSLEPKYRTMARDELHEDDYTREPALAQMREFIAKHPQIVRCRTDAIFLLRFLRFRKFNVVAACETLERFLMVTQVARPFFHVDPEAQEHLIKQRLMVPLGRNRQGNLVATIRFGQSDPKTITPEHLSSLASLLMETYIYEELYQVTGLVVVVDCAGATMAHFGAMTLPKLKIMMTATNDILAARVKQIHVVQLPKYAAVVADFCIAALSTKLQQSVEKKPATYDVYESTLEPKYQERARLELNEESFRTEPAIARMREFIAKHPRIQRCRTDAIFLLRFLRYRKFNVEAACEVLERCLTALQVSPEFFTLDLENPMIERCMCVPLGQNSDGSMVFLIRVGSFDPATFEPEQVVRLNMLALETYVYDEVYQVTGITAVIDLHGMTLAHAGAITLPKLSVIIDSTHNYLGVRIQRIHLVRLPKIAATVVDLISKALSPKLQQRIKFIMEPVPSIAKKPVMYDVYECTLEPMYLERARIELNEEDYRRESAIAQMREFIAKHPRIQRCRTDAVFLLRFLRYRKFNVMAACEALEKYLTALQVSREFFSVDPQDPLIKECLCVPLGPNTDGSMVFLIRTGHFNPESFKLEQLISLNFLALETYGYNEVLQVTGEQLGVMAPILSVEKNPATYDQYETTLEPRYLEQARREINEESFRREPAIARMREFIAKHPQIQRCRTDTIFLLRFLRYRKFNVEAACEAMEKYLTALQVSREFFNVDLDNPIIKECLCVPLGPKSDGSLVFLMRLGSVDPATFLPEEVVSLNTIALETYGNLEVYQVTGFTPVIDLLGTTLSNIGALTLPKVKIMMDAVNQFMGARIKKIHIVHLPKLATPVVELCLKALPIKLQQRVKLGVMAPILRVEKTPAREEVYQTSLEPKYLLIARDELHEDEYSREPALAQLREFIVKHPQIKQCRMDSSFLLRFLRNRKFNVTAACDAVVRYLTMKTLHPEFFKFDPLHLNKLIGEHLVVPLGEDTEGRLVLLIRYGQFNPEEHSPERQVNMIGLAIETHFDNEQYQVTGIVVVIDMLGISLAHLAVLTVPKLKVMTTITGEMKMVRIKKVHLLRVPSLAAKLAEFWISTTPAKLQQRMKRSIFSQEVYRTSLEQKYQIIARDELHEDEFSRDAALAQMREFIAKHPQIKNCRMDSVFLLRFLRNRKFNVQAACDAVVRYLTIIAHSPEYFDIDPHHSEQLIKERLVVPLGEDAEGRLVLLIRYGQFNAQQHTPEQQISLISLAIETYFDHEQYHVTGLVYVIDYFGLSMAHIGAITLPKFRVIKATNGEMKMIRVKKVHVLRVPSVGAKLAELDLDYAKEAAAEIQ
ncbi:hypothetical protein pipiens_014669, partial [Culex pipiens pipiens]